MVIGAVEMKHQDPKSVFDYIFGLTVPGVKLELSRVKTFMQHLGNPQSAYPVIHIAGTNGKGSTAAMLAAILSAYGKKTGLFTSPHLIKPNERIRVGQMLVSDNFIVEHVEAWREQIDMLGITFFEVLTALGMEFFKQMSVDLAVMETGLGGRLDATNVVDPLVSIITSVSMDHENILGDNLITIAGEKAGIIKAHKPIVLGRNPKEVRGVIAQKSQLLNAPLTYVPDQLSITSSSNKTSGQHVEVNISGSHMEFDLPLLGKHQAENFSNVLTALVVMGYPLNVESIQKGLDNLSWPGRMQSLQVDPLVLYDVAHNPQGLERLLESLRELKMDQTILIAAFNARKSIQPMVSMLEEWSGGVIYSLFEGHSSVNTESLIESGVPPQKIASSLPEAYDHTRDLLSGPKGSICFLGSHYLAETLFPMFDHAETNNK